MSWRRRMGSMLTAALALFASATATAAPPQITEDDVVRRVRNSYPMVRAAEIDREIAAGELQGAEGAFDTALRARGAVIPLGGYPQGRIDVYTEVPTTLWGTTLIGGYRWGSDSVAVYDGKYVTNDLGEVRAGASVPLWRNGPIDRRRANIDKAELGTELSGRALEQAQLDAARAAGLRYWAWVGAAQRLRVVAELTRQAEQRAADVGERVARGDLAAVEATDAERAALQRRQQRIAAERLLQESAIQLSVYLRRPDGAPDLPDPLSAPHSLPPLRALPGDHREAVQASLQRRPDLARLDLSRRQHEVEAEWADNQLAPGVDFGAVGSQDFGAGSPKRRPFELELSLLIDVPIDTDAARGRRKAARAAAAKVEVQRSLAIDQAAADMRDAYLAVEAAQQREAMAIAERKLADDLLEAERQRLELGESTVFMINLREQASLEAAIRQIDAGIEARRASIVWRAISAQLR